MINVKKIMGKPNVIVTAIWEKKYNRDGSIEKRIKPIAPRAGWITGERTIYKKVVLGYYDEGFYLPENCDPCKALTVVFWHTLNPVYAVPEFTCNNGTGMKAYCFCPTMAKNHIAKYPECYPRDSKGRFVALHGKVGV